MHFSKRVRDVDLGGVANNTSRLAFLTCDDFHARSRFDRSTIPEENGDYW